MAADAHTLTGVTVRLTGFVTNIYVPINMYIYIFLFISVRNEWYF